MILTHTQFMGRPRFEVISEFSERMVPKQAGFRWDPNSKKWWTDRAPVARRLTEYADAAAAEELARHEEAVETSRAQDFQGEIPSPDGLEYLPYQRAGIAFGMNRDAVLIGDEMGLGKTIQAIGIMNCMDKPLTLVVCPASLRLNWKREIEKWSTEPTQIQVINGKKPIDPRAQDWIMSHRTNVVIVNYDVLSAHKILRQVDWDLIICDEAHYIKNPKAARTKATIALAKTAKKKVFLTGTPIPNRPIEAWTILNTLDPNTFRSWKYYAKRYCAGFQGSFGWDVSGSSNLDELQSTLRSTIMVRRLKQEVLTELPAKRRQVVVLPANGAAKAVAAENAAYEAAAAKLEPGEDVPFEAMSEVRHEVAMAKIPYVIEHLKDALEDGKPVVCFAHHRAVIEAIAEAFDNVATVTDGPCMVTGRTSMRDRDQAVIDFQAGKAQLFIGNIQAAGVGLTLTASSTVIFAELDWVPGNVTQAEDRCHRIGQDSSVLVQHLVFDKSLDSRLVRTIIKKQGVINRALDIDVIPEVAAIEVTSSKKQSEYQEEGDSMAADQVTAVLKNLRTLAAMDQDRARTINGIGFNKIDGAIGHDLAKRETLSPAQAALGRKICKKYWGQLGDEAIKEMGI